jgi:putative tricarboxylic transport membrane protein
MSSYSEPARASLMALVLTLTASLACAQPIYEQLRIIAPAAPGGGWDQTARAMQQALQQAGIVETPIVENIPGAAGTIGLARFIGAERGRADVIMVSGLIMLGGIVTHQSPVSLEDVVPIARISGEYEVLAVPVASPFRTLADLTEAFLENPESISWGGGSAGGSDHILAGLIAAELGIAPRRVNYIAFSGGGAAMSAILGGQVSVGINGLAEFAPQIEAGAVRVLAISSAERLPGLDAPTLREQGIDLEYENWRSVVAPPGIGDADRARLASVIEAMVHSDPWRAMLARYRWLDRYLAGDAFAQFAEAEEQRVRAVLRELGTGDEATAGSSRTGTYPLLVLAGLLLFGAASIRHSVVGRKQKAELARRTGAASATLKPAWRSVALISLGMLLYILLAERAGFLIASALLFWLVARGFDARHPLRDASVAVGVSAAAYILFAQVLRLSLPAGVLAGLL